MHRNVEPRYTPDQVIDLCDGNIESLVQYYNALVDAMVDGRLSMPDTMFNGLIKKMSTIKERPVKDAPVKMHKRNITEVRRDGRKRYILEQIYREQAFIALTEMERDRGTDGRIKI